MKISNVIIGIIVFIIAIFAFLTWYKLHYSMDVAEAFEINTPDAKHRVLIATQKSRFKDAVVTGVIEHLRQQHAYIKVIDVSALPQVNENDWNAVIVIHTWEYMEPQADAQAYLDRVNDLSKVIVLTTSGHGSYKTEGLDAITSASALSDISARTLDIRNRLDSILETDTQ